MKYWSGKLGAWSITARVEMFPSKPLGELALSLLPLLEMLVLLLPLLLGSMLCLPALVLVTNLREGQVEEKEI